MTDKRRWTPVQLRLLRELYPDLPGAVVARETGRSIGSVYYKAHQMGLEKSPEFWASDVSGRIQMGKTNKGMQRTQFAKGFTPWNKGVPGSTGLHPNCRKGQFKAGLPASQSRNYLPIGSERVTSDNHVERKMTDDRSLYPARRWTAVHRLVWAEHMGEIPKGLIVVFKPGRLTTNVPDITIDRLECITRSENMKRNSFYRSNPELHNLYQLKGAIARQVNRINREHHERNKSTTHQPPAR